MLKCLGGKTEFENFFQKRPSSLTLPGVQEYIHMEVTNLTVNTDILQRIATKEISNFPNTSVCVDFAINDF